MLNQTLVFQKIVYKSNKGQGLLMGMYSLALFAALQFNFSLMLPYIVMRLGPKFTYFATQVIATGCFAAVWAINPLLPWHVLLFCTLTAWNFTAFNSIPFALTSEIAGASKSGLYMGVLNSASVVAQTVCGFIVAPIIKVKNDDVTWGIGVGGVFSVLACVAVLFMETPQKDAVLVTFNDEIGNDADITETQPFLKDEGHNNPYS